MGRMDEPASSGQGDPLSERMMGYPMIGFLEAVTWDNGL